MNEKLVNAIQKLSLNLCHYCQYYKTCEKLPLCERTAENIAKNFSILLKQFVKIDTKKLVDSITSASVRSNGEILKLTLKNHGDILVVKGGK